MRSGILSAFLRHRQGEDENSFGVLDIDLQSTDHELIPAKNASLAAM
jgi:hypothetical protein